MEVKYTRNNTRTGGSISLSTQNSSPTTRFRFGERVRNWCNYRIKAASLLRILLFVMDTLKIWTSTRQSNLPDFKTGISASYVHKEPSFFRVPILCIHLFTVGPEAEISGNGKVPKHEICDGRRCFARLYARFSHSPADGLSRNSFVALQNRNYHITTRF